MSIAAASGNLKSPQLWCVYILVGVSRQKNKYQLAPHNILKKKLLFGYIIESK